MAPKLCFSLLGLDISVYMATSADDTQNVPPRQAESELQQVNAVSSVVSSASLKTAADTAGPAQAVAWSISFAPSRGSKHRGKKEKAALDAHNGTTTAATEQSADEVSGDDALGGGADPKLGAAKAANALEVVKLNEAELVDESILVPRNLATTREDLLARKCFPVERWLCLSRPQYKRSCGVSSLTTIWNTLYSRIGYGTLPPISQEEVMTIIGFKPPFEQIRWGPFTGNQRLCSWFYLINKAVNARLLEGQAKIQGKAFIMWKPCGKQRTIGLTDDAAEETVKSALRNPNMAIIYHCKNHYCVPFAYDEQPVAPRLAMLPRLSRSEYDTQLLIGDTSRGGNPCIHVRPFAQVAQDLNTELPFTFNIRHPERGVQKLENCKKTSGTIHCFLGFRSDMAGAEEDDEELMAAMQEEQDEMDDDNNDD